MFVVYVEDNERHKDLLFTTDVLQTASSFCHVFNTRVRELMRRYNNEYYKDRSLNKTWFYESGWNGDVQKLLDELNITTDKINFSSLSCMIVHGFTFTFEEVKQL